MGVTLFLRPFFFIAVGAVIQLDLIQLDDVMGIIKKEKIVMAEFYIFDQHFSTNTKTALKREGFQQIKAGEISEYLLELEFDTEVSPGLYSITWEEDQVDMYGFWSSKAGPDCCLKPEWAMNKEESRTASGMPVICLYNKANRNRTTVALSDASNASVLKAGVVEENGKIRFTIDLFAAVCAKMENYQVIIRIDRRAVPFGDAVVCVREWWKKLGLQCAYTPDTAKQPFYSAWYSFHQEIDQEEILAECRRAKEYGMETLIVDDGWQTGDNSRGYAYCGDWEICSSKIPDMKELVDGIHALGMKFMMWFSVPFVGVKSKNYDRYKGMYLYYNEQMQASVLDPRFRQVRDFLIDIYYNYVKEYGWDGLKLDFIDSFCLTEESSTEYDKMDCISLEEGVIRLLCEVSTKLTQLNPEFMFEFRQSYVGPVVGKFGNIFRVSDCPSDAIWNRIGSLNLRLTSGNTAVHSDMLMWNKEDTVEAVAYQLLGVLFAVPQISVRLDTISEEQRKLLKSHLAFWKAHRNTLLEGKLEVSGVDTGYISAAARKDGECITVLYQQIVAKQQPDCVHYLYNAAGVEGTYVEADFDCFYEIFNVFGEKCGEGNISTGISKINVPVCGSVKMKVIESTIK